MIKEKCKILCLLFSFVLLLSACTQGDDTPGDNIDNGQIEAMTAQEFTYSQIVGTDSLGREILPVTTLNDKYVGMFYFVNLGHHSDQYYNVEELLDKYGRLRDRSEFESDEAFAAYRDEYIRNNPLFHTKGDKYDEEGSSNNANYYWGEPLFGYYDSGDEWVIRRHLELLAFSGVDFIMMDYSNLYIYDDTTWKLLRIVKEMIESGRDVPRVTMMLPYTPENSLIGLERCWNAYFETDEFDECWFYGDEEINPYGNPMVVGCFSDVTDAKYLNNLWLQPMQWPTLPNEDNALPWMDWGVKQYNHNGMMSVSVMQHVQLCSDSYLYPDLCGGRGRGWTYECTDAGIQKEAVWAGANYQQQWNYAISGESGEVNMVMLTGWNEWGAAKSSYVQKEFWEIEGQAFWVDTFNKEFSRDIEMVKGLFGDNYYMQTVQNVKNYKNGGETSVLATFDRQTIDVSAENGWSGMERKYIDFVGDCVNRDYFGFNSAERYVDNSARNDIDYVKIANDGTYLYVQAAATETLRYDNGDDCFMNLYISADTEGWEGFSFVVNRSFDLENNKASVEKFSGKNVSKIGEAEFYVFDNTISYKIPLSLLGLTANSEIGVKVCDNLQNFADIDDFYISGDSAPIGRLNYGYKVV